MTNFVRFDVFERHVNRQLAARFCSLSPLWGRGLG